MKEWLEAGICLEYVTKKAAVNYSWDQRQLTATG